MFQFNLYSGAFLGKIMHFKVVPSCPASPITYETTSFFANLSELLPIDSVMTILK